MLVCIPRSLDARPCCRRARAVDLPKTRNPPLVFPPPKTQGLGKTVQVIALICHLAETHTGPGAPPPFLIAAPASVLPNWAAELARWAPGLRVVQYKGGAAEREETYNTQARPPFSLCGQATRHISD